MVSVLPPYCDKRRPHGPPQSGAAEGHEVLQEGAGRAKGGKRGGGARGGACVAKQQELLEISTFLWQGQMFV